MMTFKTRQAIEIHSEITRKLEAVRQQILHIRTGHPVYPQGTVGRSGYFYEKMQNRNFALFELRKVSEELHQAKLDLAAIEQEYAAIEHMPEAAVYEEMRQIAEAHGIEVK